LSRGHVAVDTELVDAAAQVGHGQSRAPPCLFGVGSTDRATEFGKRLIDLELYQGRGRGGRTQHCSTPIHADDRKALGGQRFRKHCTADTKTDDEDIALAVLREPLRWNAGDAISLPHGGACSQVQFTLHIRLPHT
jgi:hypothetical protein